MFTTNPFDALVVADQRGRELHAAAAAERLSGAPATRRALATTLRWAADRLEPAPLMRRPANQP
jgi:hypothetical protein